MRDERGPWYLFTGLIIGLVIGLGYSWVISPVEFIDNAPSSLSDDFKDQYRALIAAAYMGSGDRGRAEARLSLLGDNDIYRSLIVQAERVLAEDGAPYEARALGSLAEALSQPQSAVTQPEQAVTQSSATLQPQTVSPSPTRSEVSPTGPAADLPPTLTGNLTLTPVRTALPTRTPTPSRTPLPTRTPTATPGEPFVLQDQDLICDLTREGPLLEIQTLDVDGNQVPGVEIIMTWPEGEERFFTGLKPELGLGYADFLMTPDVTYSLLITDGGIPLTGLTAEECETSTGARYWGVLSLVFAQP
jgi:hypothetical protein